MLLRDITYSELSLVLFVFFLKYAFFINHGNKYLSEKQRLYLVITLI